MTNLKVGAYVYLQEDGTAGIKGPSWGAVVETSRLGSAKYPFAFKPHPKREALRGFGPHEVRTPPIGLMLVHPGIEWVWP